MNIHLIPYTQWRHIAVALGVGASTLFAWWAVLTWIVVFGPLFHESMYWSQAFEGLIFISSLSGSAAFASIFAEGSLRRRAMRWRVGYALLSGVLSFALAAVLFTVTRNFASWLPTRLMVDTATDPSFVSLRYTLPVWGAAGVASGIGPWVVRRLQRWSARTFGFAVDGSNRPKALTWHRRFIELFFHTGGGASGAILAASIWHIGGLYTQAGGNLYLGAAFGSLSWGLVHGLLCWPIPNELYAGWIRVLSAERYGLRIPIDHEDGRPAERFVGHFPVGLDLHMPAEHGVAELHTSFTVDAEHNYAVRGLSIQPTVVKRLLESIRLDYDPSRPAPLETQLEMGDRIIMGTGPASGEVEFILLPREEM